jgi:hypothetical protein
MQDKMMGFKILDLPIEAVKYVVYSGKIFKDKIHLKPRKVK